ncbi:MAG: VPLPA-CTERM sorting domain-containing protein [Pseudomonadales bacterium]|nr:VPLPA-CTERM sorting domain-containing protein [Pseudomonadales bacterium]
MGSIAKSGGMQGILLASCMSLGVSVGTAVAAVELPMIDIQSSSADTAMSSDGSVLSIDAGVIALILEDAVDASLAGSVSLTADYQSYDALFNSYSFTNGSLTIGDTGSEYITAVFDELTIDYLASGYGTFFADLTYTGGSLYAPYLVGRLEGSVEGLSSSDLAGAFSSTSVIMKVGEVAPVPLPAAAWFLLAGLGSITCVRKFLTKV